MEAATRVIVTQGLSAPTAAQGERVAVADGPRGEEWEDRGKGGPYTVGSPATGHQ